MAELKNLPAPLAEAFTSGSPMQQMLGAVLDELGGIDFVVDWAEEYPGEFMRLVMAANPPPVQQQRQAQPNISLNIHPGLKPGPLDVVAEQ